MPETTHTLAVVRAENLSSIADAIRLKLDSSDSYTPGEMAAAIASIDTGSPLAACGVDPSEVSADGRWVRPAGCPVLDDIPIDYANDEEVVYLTYDNTASGGGPQNLRWLALALGFTTKGGQATVERGTVSNGVFTAISSQTTAAAAAAGMTGGGVGIYDYYGDDNADYVVYRITTAVSTLSHFYFAKLPAATSGLPDDVYAGLQRCIERVGNLPWLASIQASGSTLDTPAYRYGCGYLRRDAVNIASKKALISMQYGWRGCYRLVELDTSRWDTSGWAVTTLSYAFDGCVSLRRLDLSGWDTSGWEVTTLATTWNRCSSMEELDVSGWNTSGWAVTSLGNTWSNCFNLKRLDLSDWDTSGWVVTTLNNTWAYCYSLEELDIAGWDTSGWKMTASSALGSTWTYCAALRELDLSKWDVSAWRPPSCASVFAYCSSLRKIDLSKWNTSGWTITSLQYAFRQCVSLRTLKLGTLSLSGLSTTASHYTNMMDLCLCLENMDGLPGLHESLSLSRANLTRESALALFNSLATVTGSKTLTIPYSTYAQLFAADLAIATAKGWAVAAG